MAKPNGIVLYEGPSLIDGSPIVAVATFKSSNVKTGNVIQTWILHRDLSPTEASKQGADSAVCGDCPHRHSLGGACYVTLFQAPLGVWKAYKRGLYEPTQAAHAELERRKLDGQMIRLGAYGDPAAVPATVWCDLLEGARNWTGYTHQWAKPFAAPLRTICMASTDSELETEIARAMGWRAFQVMGPNDVLPEITGSIECLSDSRGKTCEECGLCNGARATLDGKQLASIWIDVHGARSKKFKPKAMRVVQ